MITANYDAVARMCMVSSLLLFVAIFTVVLIYVFRFTRTETHDRAQAVALDLPDDAIGDSA